MPTPYFSALHRFLSSRMGNSATPDQVKGMGAFFSPEERQWTGFDDHVANAGPKVYKQQLLDHMASKMPQIEPAVKGEKKTPELGWNHYPDHSVTSGYNNMVNRRPVSYKVLPSHDDTNRWYVQNSQHGILRETDSSLSSALLYPTREAAVGAANEHYAKSVNPKADPVKFKDYIVPGGKNYRENVYQWKNNPGSKYTYKTHWDESNPLFHTRTTERSFPGGKSLHLEEVQSDWHQQARKKRKDWTPEKPTVNGYKSDYKEDPNNTYSDSYQKFVGVKDKALDAVEPEKYVNWLTEQNSPILKEYYTNNAINRGQFDSLLESHVGGGDSAPRSEFIDYLHSAGHGEVANELRGAWKNHSDLHDLADRRRDALPDAPHKTSWHELALRTALHDAAQKGKTHLTWSTGDHSAGHYSLDKHIDTLRYDPDTKTLVGRMGRDQRFNQANVHPASLSDYVGDETAQKLLDSPRDDMGFHELTGQSLKVGGKGMKGFYGSIDHDTGGVQHGMLSQYANKLAKKLHGGSDAPRSEVIQGKGQTRSVSEIADAKINLKRYEDARDKFIPGSEAHTQAEEQIKRWTKFIDDAINPNAIVKRFFGIKITPQMRERILAEGVPLWGDVDSSIRKGYLDQETTIFPDVPLMQSYLVSGYEEPRPVVIRVK